MDAPKRFGLGAMIILAMDYKQWLLVTSVLHTPDVCAAAATSPYVLRKLREIETLKGPHA